MAKNRLFGGEGMGQFLSDHSTSDVTIELGLSKHSFHVRLLKPLNRVGYTEHSELKTLGFFHFKTLATLCPHCFTLLSSFTDSVLVCSKAKTGPPSAFN